MRGLRRFLIFLVGVSIPFNNVAFSFAGRNWSLGLIASAVYILTMLPDINKISRIVSYGKYIFNLLWFAILLTLLNFIHANYYGTPIIPTTMFMCSVLFYIMLLHNLLDIGVARRCMYGMALGSVMMAICLLCGIGVEFDDDSRLQMFGENSNSLGVYTCVGAIILFNDFIIRDRLNIKKFRFVLLLAYIPIVILLFATGSRVAFISFVLSFVVGVAFFKPRATRRKLIVVLLSMCIAFVLYLISQKADFVIFERLLSTAQEGNISGREHILKTLWPYAIKHLLWGVGQTGYVQISQEALGGVLVTVGTIYGISPHNVLVEILLYTGIWGLILYVSFWYKTIGCAKWIFKESMNIQPIVLFIPILGCVLSGQILYAKWAFVIYAYILAEKRTLMENHGL